MLTTLGEKIFENKYAVKGETWAEACVRVAHYISSIEKEEDKVERLAQFFQIIHEGVFVPGGRILANSGTEIKNLMNCFVLPVEDSRQGIYQTLKDASEIFAWGGGIGYNFSNLREVGAEIKSTGGNSSGPLSFMELFDLTGEIIKQSSRRGAQMGMLHISHPDIQKFIFSKSTLNFKNQKHFSELDSKYDYETMKALGYAETKEEKFFKQLRETLINNQLNHFNFSVILTDAFMHAVQEDADWNLISPSTGEVVKTVRAKALMMDLARSAWESGDPGVFFIDRAEEDNLVPYINKIEATNPCGEVPLLPYESCCLGSLNLPKFYDPTTAEKINYEFLEYAVRTGIRFLDNVQTLSEAPVADINDYSENLRRLGLGVMGWADLLALMELPYDSEEAFELGSKLSWFITFFAWSESISLAEERGTFGWFDAEKISPEGFWKSIFSSYSKLELPEGDSISHQDFPQLRNNSVTSVAPTGSIALLVGVNSSIEPFYSLAYRRNITEGEGNSAKESVWVYNPILNQKLGKLNLSNAQLREVEEAIETYGSIQHLSFLPEEFRAVFKTAHEIDWRDHIKAQASWQSYVTNAVSKTINMPKDSTVNEVFDAYMEMWKAGLKGGTIYRDQSKSFQILESK